MGLVCPHQWNRYLLRQLLDITRPASILNSTRDEARLYKVVVVKWIDLCEPIVQVFGLEVHIVWYLEQVQRVNVNPSDLANASLSPLILIVQLSKLPSSASTHTSQFGYCSATAFAHSA